MFAHAPLTRSVAASAAAALTPAFCAHCKAEGAANYCAGCSLCYCSKECQRKDWNKHKKLCKKLQKVHRVLLRPEQSDASVAAGDGKVGGGGAAAAAASGDGGGGGGGGGGAVDEEDEIENPCPVCLDNEDDATVDGKNAAICSACGQSYCGACNAGGLAVRSPNCPTCRALFTVSDEEEFKRTWKLEHDRSPGRHTPAAQCHLGSMYDNLTGVEQDHVEAAKWYQKSAEAGHSEAQYNLGCMYNYGEGVKQDHVEAVTWFRKSAEAGFADAQCNLGNMYGKGGGVEQDYVEEAKWYRKSANAGNAPAQYNLGNMYRAGTGVEQDHVEAANWYRKSAEAGYTNAQYNLALMYENGKGVEQDFGEALMWFQLAAVQGQENALKGLDLMQHLYLIPTPPSGIAVTTILLTSANAAKYNNKTGRVVEALSPDMVRPGIAFVLLDGEAKPRMFKLMNLQLE